MNTSTRRFGACVLAGLAAFGVGCRASGGPNGSADPRARGDALLHEMSDTLAGARTLSFDTSEHHDRVRRNGQKTTYDLHRQVILRRPDRLWFHATGGENRNLIVTYDGTQLTIVGATEKVYATVPAAATLDSTIDLVEDRYDFPVPMADILYSSPYDALADPKAIGGWVATETLDGRSCEKVSYQLEPVDYSLWITAETPRVPCRLEVTFKKRPGAPTMRLAFSNWNLKASTSDSQFVASVPDGYERIPVVERIPKSDLKADPAKAMGTSGTHQ
jgi:hypothetical protein